MKRMIVAFVLSASAAALATGPVSAQSPSCKSQAATKKLAGAAYNSFVRKCEDDAPTACDTAAVQKNLHGAAKDSFTNKCISDTRA
jgi:hypothetical protein